MAGERLRVLVDEIAKENNYIDYDVTIKPTSSDGANYTTELYLVTISAAGRDNVELFAKVSVIGDEMRKKMPNGFPLYETEYYFYSELYKIYENLEEKYGIPQEHRLVVPKYYKCNPNYLEEVIVLENLAAKGFKSLNRMLPVNWEYAAAAVGQLAKLHALSFAYRQEYPEEYEKTIAKLPFPMDGGEEMMAMFKNKIMPGALSVIREENRGKVAKYIANADPLKDLTVFTANNRKLIIHCDYRVSNLMHRRRNGKLEVVPLDFQTLFEGNPVTDLMYFIFTGSDAEFRKYHYTNLIEFYYTQLSAALRRLHVNVAEVYSREDFNNDIDALKLFGLIMGLTTLSLVTVEVESVRKMDDAQFDVFAATPSNVFTSRLNGIVDDYARWGLL